MNKKELIERLESLPLTTVSEFASSKWQAAALTRKLAILLAQELDEPQEKTDGPPKQQ